jgi:hypothetical protein
MSEYRLERDGEGGPGTVYRPDGSRLKPDRSQRVSNRSPSGFQWGYKGSGPHQLALGILLDHTDDREFAKRHYHDFTVEIIRHIEDDTAELPVSLIEDWVGGRKA